MKNLILAISGLSVAVFLTACGGGGDHSPAAATSTTTTTTTTPTFIAGAAKYSGTWVACFSTGTTTSRRETFVFTAQSADVSAVTFAETNYAAPGCAGTAGTSGTDAATLTFTGTKAIGSDTVDKVTVAQVGSPAGKQVFTIKGTPSLMYIGRDVGDGGTLDADGYPTTLGADGFTRQ